MNAYELADEIDKFGKEILGNELTIEHKQCEVSVMLRQQASEIGCYKIELELQKAMVQDQANRIAELEKENTNLRYLIATKLEQTKPLTDEEIEQTVKAWFNLHPACDLNEQFVTPLYSVIELCKRIAKIRGEG